MEDQPRDVIYIITDNNKYQFNWSAMVLLVLSISLFLAILHGVDTVHTSLVDMITTCDEAKLVKDK